MTQPTFFDDDQEKGLHLITFYHCPWCPMKGDMVMFVMLHVAHEHPQERLPDPADLLLTKGYARPRNDGYDWSQEHS